MFFCAVFQSASAWLNLPVTKRRVVYWFSVMQSMHQHTHAS